MAADLEEEYERLTLSKTELLNTQFEQRKQTVAEYTKGRCSIGWKRKLPTLRPIALRGFTSPSKSSLVNSILPIVPPRKVF